MVQTSPQPKEEVIEVEHDQEIKRNEEAKKDEININVAKALPFYKLLSYADKWDWTLMALGTLGSVVHGMAQPIGYLLLGKALNAFGDNINDTRAMVTALYKVFFFSKHFNLLACIIVMLYTDAKYTLTN